MFLISSIRNLQLKIKYPTSDIISYTKDLRYLVRVWIKILVPFQTNEGFNIHNLIIKLDRMSDIALFLQEGLETEYSTIEELRRKEFELIETFNHLRSNALQQMNYLCSLTNTLQSRQGILKY